MVEDAGRGWRRVVPSPWPAEIVERLVVKGLVHQAIVVIACGGGGIPVVREADGRLAGVEAVIDKDLASALLAQSIGADLLLISTQVERVSLNYGKSDQRDLDRLTLDEAKRYLSEGHFPAGSMGPKIRAAIQFLEAAGPGARTSFPAPLHPGLVGPTGNTNLARRPPHTDTLQ